MKLSIHSLKNTLFDGVAESVTCPTLAGEITVLNHHIPLITIVDKGTIKIIDDQKKELYIEVSTGTLEVQENNQARLIVEEK